MSQSFNDSLNNNENNQSGSDAQSVNDFEFQEILQDGNAEENPDNLSSPDASSDDNSPSIDIDLSEIKRKIKAVKDFSFSTKKTKDGDPIPIFPYVVALTGHRDAITKTNPEDKDYDKNLKDIAKDQLLKLVKAWNSATLKCPDRLLNHLRFARRKFIQNKSVPLIVLIGLDDENSGRFWADIASELRDEEHYNIKIIAVSFTKTRILLRTQETLKKKDDFKVIFNKADGLIELPDNSDFIKPVLEKIKENTKLDKDDALEILLRQNRIEEYQYNEYLKFICYHSHTIISLTENPENWKTANLTKFDISAFELDSDVAPSSMLDKIEVGKDHELYNQLSDIRLTLLDKIGSYFNGAEYAKKSKEEDINRILDELFKDHKDVQIPRIDRLIQYKLLGRLNHIILPLSTKKAELTFTAIGPVICIGCNRLHNGNPEAHNSKESEHKITVLIKDRYGDTDYKMIYSKNWEPPYPLSSFPEIKTVVEKLGKLNKKILANSNINNYSVEEFLEEQKRMLPPNIQEQLLDLNECAVPHELDSLVKHFHFTDKIAIDYGNQNRALTKRFCWSFAFLLVITVTLELLKNLILRNDNQFSLCQLIRDFFTLPLAGRVSPFTNWTTIQETLIAFLLIPFIFFGCRIFLDIFTSLFLKPHVHYHKFRTLAELLRIQIYWSLANLDETVPGNFHSHQSCNLDWIRTALNGLDLTLTLPLDNEHQINTFNKRINNYRLIHKLWIGVELSYFSGYKDKDKNNGFLNTTSSKIKNWISKHPSIINRMRLIVLLAGLGYIMTGPFINDNAGRLATLWGKWFVGASLSIIACWTLYTKLNLKKYKDLRNEQSLFPFRRAYLLMGIRLLYCERARTYSDKSKNVIDDPHYVNLTSKKEIPDEEEKKIWQELSDSNDAIQYFLHQLGQISIGKKADWYLCVNERELTIPKR